jgi:hypothetical protein
MKCQIKYEPLQSNEAGYNLAISSIVSHFRGDDNISFKTSDNQEYSCQKTIFIGNNCKSLKPRVADIRDKKYDPEIHGVPDNILKNYDGPRNVQLISSVVR